MTTAPPLLPVREAQARLLALAPKIATEHVTLNAAANRWAAIDVMALRTQPAADLSAMDGYAIRFDDLARPLTVIGESAAGRPFAGTIEPGQAVRIFTGAILPPGADAVLIQEDAARDGDTLTLIGDGPSAQGANVRPRGLDFRQDERLIHAGDHLTPSRIALAAMAGHGTVAVHRPIRVAIAATGDELVPPGVPLGEGQLPESNTALLVAMLANLPAEPIQLGILPDDRAILASTFAQVDADILVTTGGASVGDHDLVRPALEDIGAKPDFWKVAMRPGKPMMAARVRETVVLGLPGNPVSAFVTATLFLAPLIRQMSGASDPWPRTIKATLASAITATGPRADHIRAHLKDGVVTPLGLQDSSMLRALSDANALIVRQANTPAAAEGETVEVIRIA
ncbi:molybdopterin molybdotransferase MoeA [Sphingomonas sp. AX6]|uniref:molybdopterin molybdotransferase MoeA n=1 Tax=Sphingomonas sp. AX6 TaxID=2653171 RepID=UPI0012F2435E|nr:gephyrin-like molybdotransferase Glp [Sphingomonas sp. AX6]VXC93445.1 Molybdopterin molybdenumtransferase [Sphingomonas sp. AX6]